MRRERLREYLVRFHADSHVFYAERVWDVIQEASPDANLLAVEERLAVLSDMVIVIVESEGTFAELGAFAISPPLRAKLLPILEIRFREDPSFIRKGPVEWVDRESLFAPSIWLNQDRLLDAADQIEDRFARVPPEKARQVADLVSSPKHLFFFICDLVAIFGPCDQEDLRSIACEILETDSVDTALYVGLGTATGVLASLTFDGRELFVRPLDDGRLRAFHRPREFLDIPTLRARMLSAMQTSREGNRILEAMADM